jgi:hypothetical protein
VIGGVHGGHGGGNAGSVTGHNISGGVIGGVHGGRGGGNAGSVTGNNISGGVIGDNVQTGGSGYGPIRKPKRSTINVRYDPRGPNMSKVEEKNILDIRLGRGENYRVTLTTAELEKHLGQSTEVIFNIYGNVDSLDVDTCTSINVSGDVEEMRCGSVGEVDLRSAETVNVQSGSVTAESIDSATVECGQIIRK